MRCTHKIYTETVDCGRPAPTRTPSTPNVVRKRSPGRVSEVGNKRTRLGRINFI